MHACLSASRDRARQLNLRWRWKHLQPLTLRVTVDGNSRRTDLLCYRLERDLSVIAEGCDAKGISRVTRQRLGRGFADMVVRGRHVDQEQTMTLRGVNRTRWRYPTYDYDCPSFPTLSARLVITVDVISAYNFQEIEPEIVLEELHTACELVLEELVNRRSKRLSFAQLVSAADAAGLLRPTDLELSGAELLTELKDLRKDVRHRAAEGADAWLDAHWEDVAMQLERLVSHINRSAA